MKEYAKGVMPDFIREVCECECMYPDDCPGPCVCEDYVAVLEIEYQKLTEEKKQREKEINRMLEELHGNNQ